VILAPRLRIERISDPPEHRTAESSGKSRPCRATLARAQTDDPKPFI